MNNNISDFLEPVRISCNINVLRNSTELELVNNYISSENEEPDRLCSICQEKYIENQIIRKIKHCKHIYHQNCLDQWLENNIKCPECQYDLRTHVPTPPPPPTTNTTTSNLSSENQYGPDIYTFVVPLESTFSPQQASQQIIDELIRNINNTALRDIPEQQTSYNFLINANTTPRTQAPRPQPPPPPPPPPPQHLYQQPYPNVHQTQRSSYSQNNNIPNDMDGLRYILNREREMESRENRRMDKMFNKLKNFEKKQSHKFDEFEKRVLSLYEKINQSLTEIKKKVDE
jgi:hypothetical protein